MPQVDFDLGGYRAHWPQRRHGVSKGYLDLVSVSSLDITSTQQKALAVTAEISTALPSPPFAFPNLYLAQLLWGYPPTLAQLLRHRSTVLDLFECCGPGRLLLCCLSALVTFVCSYCCLSALVMFDCAGQVQLGSCSAALMRFSRLAVMSLSGNNELLWPR